MIRTIAVIPIACRCGFEFFSTTELTHPDNLCPVCGTHALLGVAGPEITIDVTIDLAIGVGS